MKNTIRIILLLMLVFSVQWMNGQTSPVSGTVTDSQNVPLSWVNIVEKGTTNGVVTDFDGNYTISVSGSSAVLVFSYIGYEEKEVPVGSNTNVDVSLQEDLDALDEVVVVGYGTQRKQDLTGSIVSADLKQFQESPNTNILQSLQGSLPGVTIGSTETAGAEPNIQIRGRSTLNGSQDPLVVLDGVIYRGRLSDINPKDIKSVDVLKDPSSKAIYGAQAANGIVIVSTKKGKSSQKTTINFSTYLSVQTPTQSRRTLNREEYLTAARDTDWQNGYLAPDFTEVNPDWTIENNTAFFPPLLEGLGKGTDFNWFDALTDPGYIRDHQLSIAGSSNKTSYYISAGLTSQEGWVLNDNYDRKTVRVNFDTQLYDWLQIGVNTFGSFSDFSGVSPNLSTLPAMSPLTQPKDENGEYIINPLGNSSVNPFLQTTSDDRDNLNNISAIFYASIDVPQVPGLNFRVNYSNNYRWSLRGNSDIYGAGLTGRASKQNTSTFDTSLDNILTYEKRFGTDENHGFKATLVAGFNTVDFEQTRAVGTGFSNLALSYNSLEQAVIQQISSDAWTESYLAQTGRINYDYKRKYLLSASLRRDGFSGFAANNKTSLFPSIGLGWVVSKENFLMNSTFVDNLKLRGSYGVNGNLTSRYSSLARLEAPSSSRYLFGDGGTTINGQTVVSLANPDLKWERTKGINVGVDFALFDNKISGSVDYYKSKTYDLLWDFILPEISGFSSIRSNVGELENSGVEFALDFNPVHTDHFNWNFGVNFASNQNKINKLLGEDRNNDGKEDDLVANGLFIGESIGAVYSYEINGIYQIGDTDIPDGWVPGQYRLKDLDGDGAITPEGDKKIIGKTEPAYQFGIKNSLSYNNFTFNFFISSVQGGKNSYIQNNDPWSSPNFSYSTPTLAQSSNRFSDIDYWTPKNPGARFNSPGVSTPIYASHYRDRSFIRLQDISLAYNMGSHLMEKIGLQNIKLYASGKNLLTFTDWDGWDPETGQGLGISNSGLPVMKSITFGLDISF